MSVMDGDSWQTREYKMLVIEKQNTSKEGWYKNELKIRQRVARDKRKMHKDINSTLLRNHRNMCKDIGLSKNLTAQHENSNPLLIHGRGHVDYNFVDTVTQKCKKLP